MEENKEQEVAIDKSKLTEDEIKLYEEKAKELETKHNVPKVHVCVLIDSESGNFERYPAYIKEPDFMNKLVLMDKAGMLGTYVAAEELRELFQCKGEDESHPYTFSDLSEFERFKLGVVKFCIGIIKISQDKLKKN